MVLTVLDSQNESHIYGYVGVYVLFPSCLLQIVVQNTINTPQKKSSSAAQKAPQPLLLFHPRRNVLPSSDCVQRVFLVLRPMVRWCSSATPERSRGIQQQHRDTNKTPDEKVRLVFFGGRNMRKKFSEQKTVLSGESYTKSNTTAYVYDAQGCSRVVSKSGFKARSD